MGRTGRISIVITTVMVLLAASVSTAAATGPDSVPGPNVTAVVTCLAGNGRVDVNIVNKGPVAASYELQYAALSKRVATVQADDWGRFSITGRPNGTNRLVVRRDGQIALDTLVQVLCTNEFGQSAVYGPEVEILNGCRFGRGYLLVQLRNNRPESRPYVITFDEGRIPNRSTTAAPYGAAVRAVTGRPDGNFPILVRSGSEVVYEGTVTVACDPASADRATAVQRTALLPVIADGGAADAPNNIDSAAAFSTELIAAWDDPRGSIVGLSDGRLVSTSDSTFWIHSAADPTVRTEASLPTPAFDLVDMVELPDGRVAGADFSTVRIFDPDAPAALVSLTTSALIADLDRLPDGRIVALSEDGIVRVWPSDVAAPIEIDLADQVDSSRVDGDIVALDDGRVLVSLGFLNAPVVIVDPDAPAEIVTVLPADSRRFNRAIGMVATTGVAIVATDDDITAWDPAGSVSDGLILPGSNGNYRSVAGLTDGSIAASDGFGHVDIWAPPYDNAPRRLDGSVGGDLVALPGSLFATAGYAVRQLWDTSVTTGPRFVAHPTATSAVAALPDGRIATGDWNGNVYVWDRTQMHSPSVITNRFTTANIFDPRVSALASMPGNRIAIGKLKEVRIFGLDDPAQDRYFSTGALRTDKLVASRTGLLAGLGRNQLVVFDPDLGDSGVEGANVVVDLAGTFYGLDVFSDGRFVFAGEEAVTILDPTDGSTELVSGLDPDDGPFDVAVLSDGRLAVDRFFGSQTVIIDPAGAVAPIDLDGRFIGQRDDGLVVLRRSAGATQLYAAVDLANPTFVRDEVSRPSDVFFTEVAGNSLLGAFGKGWVLFD